MATFQDDDLRDLAWITWASGAIANDDWAGRLDGVNKPNLRLRSVE